MMREALMEGENIGCRLTLSEKKRSRNCAITRGGRAVRNETDLMQQFSRLSEHANITMPFTLKDKNTLVAKPLFHLTTSKRPIDYSKWPLPNIHYDCHLSTMQPPGQIHTGLNQADGKGEKKNVQTACNKELKKNSLLHATKK